MPPAAWQPATIARSRNGRKLGFSLLQLPCECYTQPAVVSNVHVSRMTAPADLAGIHEIAQMAGVTSQAVANWRIRYPDFPAPLATLNSGPVFNLPAVRHWLAHRRSHALGTTVKPYVYPLFGEGDEGRPYLIASCIHLGIGDFRFLVTAAHAWAQLRVVNPSIGIGGPLVPLRDVTAWRNAKYDLTVISLDDATVARMTGCPYVMSDDFDLNVASLAPLYVAVGYPVTQSRPRYRRPIIRAGAIAYTSTPATAAVYSKLGLRPQLHIAINFPRRKVAGAGGLQTAPKPNGMSGGGFWSVSEADPNRPKLAGIALDYPAAARGGHRESHALIAVRSFVALAMIRQSTPTVAGQLPRLPAFPMT